MKNKREISVKKSIKLLHSYNLDKKIRTSRIPHMKKCFDVLFKMRVKASIEFTTKENVIVLSDCISYITQLLKKTHQRKYITHRVKNRHSIVTGFTVWRLK